MKNFVIAIISGIGFVSLLTLSSVAGLLSGIWGESDRLARLWEVQYFHEFNHGKHAMNHEYFGTMYWVIRVFAFIYELMILTLIFYFLLMAIVRIVWPR